ncbi:MAG TPA: hypothetical protein VMU24_05540 [Candidatus Acidoferrales bacterium]|nr:hypothetical protein [Candidatus Acidoferrales bacterium]
MFALAHCETSAEQDAYYDAALVAFNPSNDHEPKQSLIQPPQLNDNPSGDRWPAERRNAWLKAQKKKHNEVTE